MVNDILSKILKEIDDEIKSMDSFYDYGYYVGNIDFVNKLPKYEDMIEARIHALMILKERLKEIFK